MDVDVARIRRVLRKPPRYVAWRVAEETQARARWVSFRRAAAGRGPLVAGRIVPGGIDAALPITLENLAGLAPWSASATVIEASRRPREAAMLAAGAARRREFELFGDEPISVPIPTPWSTDVRSKHGWPRGYHRTLDYFDAGRRSDVKIAWELSRLRHLVELAVGSAVGAEAAERSIHAELRSWHGANPLGWSVNWAVGMEVALRAVNLICVDGLLSVREGSPAVRRTIVGTLYQHGWHLSRHLEVSDINGNHFLANAAGLAWLGRYFAGVGEAAAWSERALDMTVAAAREQVLPGGLDHEGSLPYHALVLELFALCRHALGPRATSIDDTLEAMTDALGAILEPDGRVPDLGDDDGGRALAFARVPSRDGRRVLGLVGAVLGHARDGAPDEPHELDAIWLTGRTPPRTPAVVLPRRIDEVVVLGNSEERVTVDVGSVGFRGRGGHGHVDALSFTATLGGRLAIRDSGTATYTGHPELRDALRSAEAHNLCVVDGLPYARPGATLWAVVGDSKPTLEALACRDGVQRLVLEQTVPARGGRATVRRTIEWSRGVVRWSDEVRAPPGARVVQYTQLPDDARSTDATTLRAGGLEYRLDRGPAAELQLVTVPWSERYGSIGSARRAVIAVTATTGCVRLAWSARCT